MTLPAPALEAVDLSVRYGDVVAADGVSLRVAAGEIFGLLGPNGAGKTSVIRALTTVVPVSRGTATVGGHHLTDPRAVRASIGVLPESNGYPGAQSAPAYLRFFGQLFGLSASEANARADRLLRRMGLGDNDQRIATFSRGMRQRLGLCRALINEPAVLFLDEPTLGLDPAGQEELMAHLARTAVEDGTCVILCSHLLDEVERVCDRIAIMHRSRIVADGTVDEVVAASGVTGYGKLRIAADDVAAATAVLQQAGASTSLRFDNSRPGEFDVAPSAIAGGLSTILRHLLDAGIEPRAFDLTGGRLSDAFLALTGTTAESA